MDDNIVFSFFYDSNPKGYWYEVFEGDDDAFEGSELRIAENPESIMEYKEDLTWTKATQGDFWGIANAKLWSSNKATPLHEGEACISNTARSTILSNNASYLRDRISLELCGEYTCSSGSIIDDAPELTLTFNDTNGNEHRYTIDPREYMYDDAAKVRHPSIEDITPLHGTACSPTATFGFGRMYLFNRLVMMNINRDGNRSIGIFNYSSRPSMAHADNVKALVWIGWLAILGTFGWIMYMRSFADPDKKTVAKGIAAQTKGHEMEELNNDGKNGKGE